MSIAADETRPLLSATRTTDEDVAVAAAAAAALRPRRSVRSTALSLVALLLAGIVVLGLSLAVWDRIRPPAPPPPPPPSLATEANVENVLRLLRKLESIAKGNPSFGGSRSTTRGHAASVDFAVAFLQNHTRLSVRRQPFQVKGQKDGAPPLFVAKAAAAPHAQGMVRNYSAETEVATAVGSGSGALQGAPAFHVLGCDPVLDLAAFKANPGAIAVVGVDGAPSRSLATAATSASLEPTDPFSDIAGPSSLPPSRLAFPSLGATPSCPRACDRAAAAIRAGAKGVVFYPRLTPYGYPWALPPSRRIRCTDQADFELFQSVPVVALSQEAGYDVLLRVVSPEGLRVDLAVNSTYSTVDTWNVIAETTTGDPEKVLIMGSHLDSVEAGPGINDDGSGAMATLELAFAFSRSGLANKTVQKVRFAWWGAEETGLEGSRFYVENLFKNNPAELARIKLTIDTDMIGSPNYVRGIWNGRNVANDALRGPATVIQEVIEQWFEKKGLPTVPFDFNGRSDFAPFMNRGIPAGGVITGEDEIKTHEQAEIFGGIAGMVLDPCYHQACDTVESLRGPGRQVLEENLAALAHTMERFAMEDDVEGLLAGRVPI
ncbi:hypothetical protein DFJ73DRAFT_838634 [Zopfochytrium polystomum]|nr:hypothetical protein DFJ73DRAFT_838634 [Zopfochytrium polystomum]